jgi:hypothetical protein
MTPADVLQKVADIEAAKGDPEIAHGLEDDLYRSVLSAIAHGARNPKSLADAALHTQLVDFPRWRA